MFRAVFNGCTETETCAWTEKLVCISVSVSGSRVQTYTHIYVQLAKETRERRFEETEHFGQVRVHRVRLLDDEAAAVFAPSDDAIRGLVVDEFPGVPVFLRFPKMMRRVVVRG